MSKVYVKYTGRVNKFVGNRIEVVPVWHRRPSEKEDIKTGQKTQVPGIPLIAMNGPFDMETAQNFIAMRERENTTSASTWEIVPEAELHLHTDVTANNVRG